jgi:hypothetical protein
MFSCVCFARKYRTSVKDGEKNTSPIKFNLIKNLAVKQRRKCECLRETLMCIAISCPLCTTTFPRFRRLCVTTATDGRFRDACQAPEPRRARIMAAYEHGIRSPKMADAILKLLASDTSYGLGSCLSRNLNTSFPVLLQSPQARKLKCSSPYWGIAAPAEFFVRSAVSNACAPTRYEYASLQHLRFGHRNDHGPDRFSTRH